MEETDILADNDPAEYPSVDAYVDAVKVCAEETTGSNLNQAQIVVVREQWTQVHVKLPFQEWCGGFEPEGPHQIRTYLDTAVDSDLNQEKVKQILEDWLYEQ